MSKNWIGNSNSLYKTLGASSHTKEEREENDYYATSEEATKWLLKIEDIQENVIENSVGEGHIAKVLQDSGKNIVRAFDVVDRGFPNTEVLDYLSTHFEEKFDADVVMNPPYKYAETFVRKSINDVNEGCKVFAFLKIQFLESKKRKKLFEELPPKTVWVSSSRLLCAKNGEFAPKDSNGKYIPTKGKISSSAVCYCWFVWEKGYKGETIVKWFN